MSNITDLYGASIDFLYDPSLLQVQSITKGDIFGSNTILTPLGPNGKITNGQANFAITLQGNKPGVTATSGTIAVIKAKVLKAGTVKLNTTSSNSELSLSGNTIRVKLSNPMANIITYATTNKDISLTAPVTPSPSVTLNAGTYQEDNNALVYTGNCKSRTSNDYDNNDLKIGTATNSSVEFKFNGTSFEWYGTKANNRGIATVYIDGKEVKSVDAYASSTAFKQLLYKSDTLSSGIHTAKIVVSGSKNDKSSNIQVDVDKIVIKNETTPSTSVTLNVGTYQEDNSALVYTGTWKSRNSNDYDNNALKLGTATNSAVEFTFNGTSFEWYGTKANNRGIATVYIDGKEVKSVDAYASSTAFTELLYKSDTLASGTHTVKIVASGSKNPLSSNIQIDLDKIVIN